MCNWRCSQYSALAISSSRRDGRLLAANQPSQTNLKSFVGVMLRKLRAEQIYLQSIYLRPFRPSKIFGKYRIHPQALLKNHSFPDWNIMGSQKGLKIAARASRGGMASAPCLRRAPSGKPSSRRVMSRQAASLIQLPQKFIVLTLNKLRPSAARSWLATIRHFMQYAVSAGLCASDPTQGVKLPKVKKTDGFYTWSEQDIAEFEAAHPIGTKARLAFALLLFTAQRRGGGHPHGTAASRDG